MKMAEHKNDESIEEKSNNKVSEFRNVASQCFAALAINLLKFSFGTFMRFYIELYYHKRDSDFNFVGASFYGASHATKLISAIPLGILAQFIGCRLSLLITAASFTFSWLLFISATNTAMLLAAYALVALTSFTVTGPGTTYVAESSQPRFRGILMASGYMCELCGVLFVTLLYEVMHWRHLAFVNLAFSVMGFAAIYMLPDSPHWLISKGRLSEAEQALAWLRGWTAPADVRSEFLSLTKPNTRPTRSYGWNVVPTIDTQISSFPTTIRWPYFHRSFWLPLLTISYLLIVRSFTSGEISLWICFENDDLMKHINPTWNNAQYMALGILGSFICIVAIRSAGKRKLLFFSLSMLGLTYFVAFKILNSRSENYWLLSTIFNTWWFATRLGLDSVIGMFIIELFPARVRNVGVGIGGVIDVIWFFKARIIFSRIVEETHTVEGVLLCSGIMCVIGIATILFIVPETEGRSLQEIESRYYQKIGRQQRRGKVWPVAETGV